MTATVYQSAGVAGANAIATSIQQLKQALAVVRSAVDNYANNGVSAMLQQMPYATFNDDGTLTSVGVPTFPNEDNPIDPAKVQNFSQVQKPYNFDAAFGLCQQFVNLMTGAAVTQQPSAPNIVSLFAP